MNQQKKHTRFYNGVYFTLVELLIVIAIILILMSMLMPALKKAKGSATKIACMGNLRQFGSGMGMYLQDNNRYFMDTNGGHSIASEAGHTCLWMYFLRQYYSQPTDGRYYWSVSHEVLPFPDVEKCPADTKYTSGRPEAKRLGFSAVAIVNGYDRQWSPFYKKPSQAPIIWDNDFINNSATYSDYKWWNKTLINQRHQNSLNYWFLDGHVMSKPNVTSNQLWAIHTYGDRDFN